MQKATAGIAWMVPCIRILQDPDLRTVCIHRYGAVQIDTLLILLHGFSPGLPETNWMPLKITAERGIQILIPLFSLDGLDVPKA